VSDSFATVAQFVARTLDPLTSALASGDARLIHFVHRLGWELPTLPPALGDLRSASERTVAALANLEREITRKADGEGSDVEIGVASAEFLVALALLSDAVRALPDGLRTQLPQDFLEASRIVEELLPRLFSDAICRRLEVDAPALFRFAKVLGFVEVIEHAPDPARFQPSYEERAIRWDRVAMLTSGPGELMRDVYDWGTGNVDARKLVLALRDWSFAIDSPAHLDWSYGPLAKAMIPALPDTASPQPGVLIPFLTGTPIELGVGVYALPTLTPDEPQGLMLTLAGLGALEGSFQVTPSLTLEVEGQIDLASGVALALWPDRPPRLVGNAITPTPSPVTGASATVRLRHSLPDAAQRIPILNFRGLQVSARGVVIEVGFGVTAGEDADVQARVNLPGLRLELGGLGQDSFLSDVLPDGAAVDFDLAVGWSLAQGLFWQTGGGPSLRIPIARRIGPAEIDALEIEFGAPNDTYDFTFGISGSAKIGPVEAHVERLGFAVKADPQGGNFGLFGLSASVEPPRGVGLTVAAHGVVTGGGFLRHDPAAGLYAGVLQLTLQERLTLTAYGLIATRLPDGRPGYSLLIFLTADGFEPVPLGLGFLLQRLGGLVGVHRTFDAAVLRAGLRTDTLGTLLFPRDPVGNAPALLRALGAAFPAQRGSYLLGLLARITWFTPTLLQLDLALVLELGQRTRLLVLGRVSAQLPSAEHDLIRLLLNAVGVLDFDAGTLAVDAVLVDSRLVHRFPVTGAAAVRARWTDTAAEGRHFVAAVGGLHPRFAAPTGFPALERVAIALTTGRNPRLVCEAYFAVTANTVQFGARAALYAEALGFSVTGEVAFDALVTLVPPHFLATFHARVQLKRGTHSLFALTLDGRLEGPLPLRVAATARFELLWMDFTVPFHFTLADGAPAAAAGPAVRLEDAVRAALAQPANWRTQALPGLGHGVALRARADAAAAPTAGAAPVLDPLGQLVVEQQVAPLNLARDVETYGGQPLAGARRFALAGTMNGQAGTPVPGAFAPARYFRLSEAAQLAAPAFDTLDAGLVLGDATVRYAAPALVTAPLAYAPITLPPHAAPAARPVPAPRAPRAPLARAALATQVATGAAARAPARRTGRPRFRAPGLDATTATATTTATPPTGARLTAPAWILRRLPDGLSDGAPDGAPDTPAAWTALQPLLARRNRARAAWHLVPAYEP
jgi:hypothetical protein